MIVSSAEHLQAKVSSMTEERDASAAKSEELSVNQLDSHEQGRGYVLV